MQKILDELQQFVPQYNDGDQIMYAAQGIVGDQLTVDRGVNGLFEVGNGITAEEQHEGLHFEIADFHGGMKFLEVCNEHVCYALILLIIVMVIICKYKVYQYHCNLLENIILLVRYVKLQKYIRKHSMLDINTCTLPHSSQIFLFLFSTSSVISIILVQHKTNALFSVIEI